jgi:hypothetical protein
MAALAPYGIEPSQGQVASLAALLERQIRASEVRSSLQIREGVDILRFIKEAQDAGDVDEALWRAFLAAHFGRPSAGTTDEIKSAGRFLCAFGERPAWTWTYISAEGAAFINQLFACEADLRTLRFGNHRKFRSQKPGAIAEVIMSFAQVVRDHGGCPSAAFTPEEGMTPQEGFDQLYHRFLEVNDFGRLGCFDLLCLLGEMRLLNIQPGSCYLEGSTGPLKGARELCGKRSPQQLNAIMDHLAARLGISYAMMEDALCLWQKKPKKQPGGLPRDVMYTSFVPIQDIRRVVKPG